MLSKEAIVQIIYSTIKIESLTDSVEGAAQKIMELAQQTNNKQSVPCKCSRTYLALNGFNKICLDCGKVQ